MRIHARRMAAMMIAAISVLTMAPGVSQAAHPAPAAADKGNVAGAPFVFTRKTGLGVTQVINCWGRVDHPHNSTGTPSAVTGKSQTWCDAPIAQISAQTELYRYLDGYGYTLVGIGSLAYELNHAGPVVSTAYDICQGRLAYWAAVGRHRLVAPPGFQPPSITLTTGTPGVGVNC
ncbi:hypothetical protein [Allorhizocola rhizosphaerae]|uniref:hypothetical protein n=1 Tax=Allorhizocola rhizosphaerae TaxID=1872709 RepID=UPI0013C32A50|nr:hypothetical protein [Allorhizocola rhizosphaerae]